jgi:hypothetical protein
MRTTKIHRRIYEDYHKVSLLPGIEIHHIDGNHQNNNIENLLAVTPEEHYNIHYQQGDYAAALLITGRVLVDPAVKSKLASLAAVKGNAEGKCGFVLGHASEAGKLGGKAGGAYAKKNRTGIFALSPEKNKERHFNSVVSRLIKNGKASAWPKRETI